MKRKEQKQFINDLVSNVKADILQFHCPESWDEIELRWLVAENFSSVAFNTDKRKRRYKDFENHCIVNNWL